MAKASRLVLGDSLLALRFIPALSGAIKILLIGLMVKEFGGGRFATALACLAYFVAPVYQVTDLLFSMNAVEPIFWTGGAYAAVLAIKRAEPRWWLLFGLLAGLGLQNKHSMVFFGFAIFVGVLATSARRFLLNRSIWIGGVVAVLLFLPNIITGPPLSYSVMLRIAARMLSSHCWHSLASRS
jgi:4-amino-4-deoxy-L-arabinose transferase-like glycosyltransferase